MQDDYLPFSSKLASGEDGLFVVTEDEIEVIPIDGASYTKKNLIGVCYSMDLRSIYFDERMVLSQNITKYSSGKGYKGQAFLVECEKKQSRSGAIYKQLKPKAFQDIKIINSTLKKLKSRNGEIIEHRCFIVDKNTKTSNDSFVLADEDMACCGCDAYPKEFYDNNSDDYYQKYYDYYAKPSNKLNIKINIIGVDTMSNGKNRFYLDSDSYQLVMQYHHSAFTNGPQWPNYFIGQPMWCAECYFRLEYINSVFNVDDGNYSNKSIHLDSYSFLSDHAFVNRCCTVSYSDFSKRIFHSYNAYNISDITRYIEIIKERVTNDFKEEKLNISLNQFWLDQK